MTGVERQDDRARGVAHGADLETAREGRCAAYGVLAALLSGAPSATLLSELGSLPGPATAASASSGSSALGEGWQGLAAAARDADESRVAAEYHVLFIGLTQGELVPYASWYRNGALMDRSLVRLRRDLARLGFAREAGIREPEDHAATLCAVMQALLAENDEEAAGAFFRDHLAPWMKRLFADMHAARSAVFYRGVAGFGERLRTLESIYWSLPDEAREPVPSAPAATGQARIER